MPAGKMSEKEREKCEQDIVFTLRHYFPDGARAIKVIEKCCELTNQLRLKEDGSESKYAENLRYARLGLVNRGIMKKHKFGSNRQLSCWELTNY